MNLWGLVARPESDAGFIVATPREPVEIVEALLKAIKYFESRDDELRLPR